MSIFKRKKLPETSESASNVTPPAPKPSVVGLLFRGAIGIFLLDRWVFEPLKVVAGRKGPLFVFGKAARSSTRRKKNVKSKHWLWIGGAVVLGAAAVWYFFFNPKTSVSSATLGSDGN